MGGCNGVKVINILESTIFVHHLLCGFGLCHFLKNLLKFYLVLKFIIDFFQCLYLRIVLFVYCVNYILDGISFFFKRFNLRLPFIFGGCFIIECGRVYPRHSDVGERECVRIGLAYSIPKIALSVRIQFCLCLLTRHPVILHKRTNSPLTISDILCWIPNAANCGCHLLCRQACLIAQLLQCGYLLSEIKSCLACLNLCGNKIIQRLSCISSLPSLSNQSINITLCLVICYAEFYLYRIICLYKLSLLGGNIISSINRLTNNFYRFSVLLVYLLKLRIIFSSRNLTVIICTFNLCKFAFIGA